MSFDGYVHDAGNPDPWAALALDRSTLIEKMPKEALMRNNGLRARQLFFPLIRPLARLTIVLVQLLRIAVPRRFTSSRLLHGLIVWGMKNFVHPDANYLILRHFNIGTQILRFIADNSPRRGMPGHPLRPVVIEDLRDNVFLQHDLNIYNFIIQLNKGLEGEERPLKPLALQEIDFSAIEDIDAYLTPAQMPRGRFNVFDLQTAIEFYTPLYALFLSDDDFWRASNSLQLDETVAIYVATIFNREAIIGMVNNKHPMVPFSTLEAGYRLLLHGLDAENLYGFIKEMQRQQARGLAAPQAA